MELSPGAEQWNHRQYTPVLARSHLYNKILRLFRAFIKVSENIFPYLNFYCSHLINKKSFHLHKLDEVSQ